VKHGKVNATLPSEDMISTVTLEEALELIAAKAGKGKSKPRAGAAKSGARAAAKTRKK
jgi:DNA topoisomerase-1